MALKGYSVFGASNYSAIEATRDGRKIEIRALSPEDQAGLIAAVRRSSAQSLYRRFQIQRRKLCLHIEARLHWTTPAAVAIPEGDYVKDDVEQGR